MDRRQLYKAKLLQERYQHEIQAALAARLAFVERQQDRVAITLRGGGRVVDHGDRLMLQSGRDQEVMAAIALAQAKGWKTLSITGSDGFKARLWIEAARAGLTVAGYEPSSALRAQFDKEKLMLGQQGAGGMALTPDSTAQGPNARAKHRWEEALRIARDTLAAELTSVSPHLRYALQQQRKKVEGWLAKVEKERRVGDDLLWEIGHHEIEVGKLDVAKFGKSKSAALAPLFQLRRDEIENRKQAADGERAAQLQREIAAQQQVDAIADQISRPGLTVEQQEQLEERQRYYQALADGRDEAEAREHAANPNSAPRPH